MILPFEVHLTIESTDENAIDRLQTLTDLSRQRIKFAMSNGAVWRTRGRNTRRLRRAKNVMQVGDELHLYYDEKVLAEQPQPATLVADLGGYSVWNKPYGMRSQGSKWGDHCTITRWAERTLQPQRSTFTVHRLDRAAKGLILVAHTKRIAATLSTMFRDRTIEKGYRACVVGDFSLLASPVRVTTPIDGKVALSEFRFLSRSSDAKTSHVDVRIETGRKHQIRRHLAELNYPIVGDRLHGISVVGDVDLQLTACRLAFVCPIGNKPVVYSLGEAPV